MWVCHDCPLQHIPAATIWTDTVAVRFRTNLFGDGVCYTYVTMHNAARRSVVDVRYDKRTLVYDINRNTTVIPAESLAFDFDDYDEDNAENKAYKELKPRSLTFTRRKMNNLHYMV